MTRTLAQIQTLINIYLTKHIRMDITQSTLADAMEYSLNAGGKRLRPALTITTLDAFGFEINDTALKAVCAVELLHTYSLIHDDLPAMDNDDLRRGLPTNHTKYGAGMATLAGDGLLTLAFQWLTDNQLADDVKSQLVLQLSRFAGPAGMVAGQAMDIEGEKAHLTMAQLQQLHRYKTGALITYSVVAAGIISQQNRQTIKLLHDFGASYGLAFQIYDDILDVVGTKEQLGKEVNKDQNEHKNTYPGLLGLNGAKQALRDTLRKTQQQRQKLVTVTGNSFSGFDEFFAYFKI
ncbi:farnesyl-diphosphate synthase [Paucilactobacillus hokkaidonensis JCM 18461]|uniref:Farnesyl diphosphate synthase n=2 Tax=Paucilactobacillus hokkaidonensis TaxID=1193095 RepID=A0A0A1GTE3_9LACO|nr:farnesyl diphosphate synthase [Paucilactobacillus hokkaidonensis]KRO09777.1 geranyltranstransferase [Paucilactobacillus hokkaidonensis]BAP85557.1 farnesyl-diphosphate synthase [Paucilactobacillus hokkaidonensis JCM 18461]